MTSRNAGPSKRMNSAITRGTSAFWSSRTAYLKPSACAALTKSLVCRLLSLALKRPLWNSFCHCLTMPSPQVVEHHDFDRQIIGRDGFQLADIHADAGIAVDIDDETAALRELRAHRRRQPETHGAHAARGQPQPRSAEVEILRGPHLVLADAGGDDGLAARQPVDLFDDVVRLDQRAVAIVVHRVLRRAARCNADATATSRA